MEGARKHHHVYQIAHFLGSFGGLIVKWEQKLHFFKSDCNIVYLVTQWQSGSKKWILYKNYLYYNADDGHLVQKEPSYTIVYLGTSTILPNM